MSGIFKIVRISTIRFVKLHCDALNIQYLDWDGNADLTQTPKVDLAGINGFAVANNGKLHDFSFGITAQTLNDPNLFRLTDIVDSFYSSMLPEKTFSIIHPDTGVVLGSASFVEGAAVHPVNRIETRVTASVQGSFVVDLTE